MSEKKGFSVVAPMRTSRPSSTNGSSTSCWAREKRWTSSRKRIVPWPRSPRRARARSATSRTSFTPALTADRVSNALAETPATRRAMVVFPVPGGPQKTTDESRSDSIRMRSGLPGPRRCDWPATSSRDRGRNRAASGARSASRSSTAAANRSGPFAMPGRLRGANHSMSWRGSMADGRLNLSMTRVDQALKSRSSAPSDGERFSRTFVRRSTIVRGVVVSSKMSGYQPAADSALSRSLSRATALAPECTAKP